MDNMAATEQTTMATPQECLLQLGAGNFSEERHDWAWTAEATAKCGFGEYDQPAARAMLSGQRLTFIGDSTARRWMWAMVDAVGSLRRDGKRAVPDSTKAFDLRAVAINDSVFDSARAYHAGQVVLLNVTTGKWVMLDPLQLCGVPRNAWSTDRRYVDALQQGKRVSWAATKGGRFRLLLSLAERAPRPFSGGGARRLLRQLADAALGVTSNKCLSPAGAQRCSFRELQEARCSSIQVHLANPRQGRVRNVSRPEQYAILTGETGGHCASASHRLMHALSTWFGASGGDRASSGSFGGRRGPMVRARHARAGDTSAENPALSARLRDEISKFQLVGDIELAPFCESSCRESYRLVCPGGFDAALRAALVAHAPRLGIDITTVARPADVEADANARAAADVTTDVNARSSALLRQPSLAVLSFVYAVSLEPELTQTLEGWRNDSFGFGADHLFIASNWASVLAPSPRRRSPAGARSERAVLRESGQNTAALPPPPPPPLISWTDDVQAAWERVAAACDARRLHCAVRTVLHHARQPQPQPYREFERRLLPLLRRHRVPAIPLFEATWWGVQLGVLHHHDSTRIHFDDFGRIFLAQLTLNALPLLTAMERDDAPSLQSRIGARHHLSNVGSIGLLELQKQPF